MYINLQSCTGAVSYLIQVGNLGSIPDCRIIWTEPSLTPLEKLALAILTLFIVLYQVKLVPDSTLHVVSTNVHFQSFSLVPVLFCVIHTRTKDNASYICKHGSSVGTRREASWCLWLLYSIVIIFSIQYPLLTLQYFYGVEILGPLASTPTRQRFINQPIFGVLVLSSIKMATCWGTCNEDELNSLPLAVFHIAYSDSWWCRFLIQLACAAYASDYLDMLGYF
jgi:hypothetical protein